MKARNLHFYGEPERLKALKEEYDYCARNATRMVAPDHLVVLALPPKARKKKDDEKAGGDKKHVGRKTNGYSR